MKRLFSSLLVLLLLLTSLFSCMPKEQHSSTDDSETTSVSDFESDAESSETKLPEVTLPKSVRILSIGNSFSDDAMEHFWNILNDLGIEEIILGNLYIGGCSIDRHYANMQSREAVYQYRKNTSGTWISKKDSLPNALADEAWDYVTFQQASQDSGRPNSYGNFDALVELVKSELPRNCELYFHMTWAYQQNSTHAGFANYNNDQMTMYQSILNAVNEKVMDNTNINDVIPAGTAIQNLRTSYLGDTLTRDGYHMSYGIGRYTVSMAWAGFFFGADAVDLVKWHPDTVPAAELPAIREAAKNAVEEPFAVTSSTYSTGPDISDRFATAGLCFEDYGVLPLSESLHAYYNCTNATHPTELFTGNNTAKKFSATRVFTKEELPVGSVFVCEKGYQYRPEAWRDVSTPTNTRPANSATSFWVLDDAFWGQYTLRAFNISKVSGEEMTNADLGKLMIYVKKAD